MARPRRSCAPPPLAAAARGRRKRAGPALFAVPQHVLRSRDRSPCACSPRDARIFARLHRDNARRSRSASPRISRAPPPGARLLLGADAKTCALLGGARRPPPSGFAPHVTQPRRLPSTARWGCRCSGCLCYYLTRCSLDLNAPGAEPATRGPSATRCPTSLAFANVASSFRQTAPRSPREGQAASGTSSARRPAPVSEPPFTEFPRSSTGRRIILLQRPDRGVPAVPPARRRTASSTTSRMLNTVLASAFLRRDERAVFLEHRLVVGGEHAVRGHVRGRERPAQLPRTHAVHEQRDLPLVEHGHRHARRRRRRARRSARRGVLVHRLDATLTTCGFVSPAARGRGGQHDAEHEWRGAPHRTVPGCAKRLSRDPDVLASPSTMRLRPATLARVWNTCLLDGSLLLARSPAPMPHTTMATATLKGPYSMSILVEPVALR